MAKKLPLLSQQKLRNLQLFLSVYWFQFENTLTNFEKYRKEARFTLLSSERCIPVILKIDAFR